MILRRCILMLCVLICPVCFAQSEDIIPTSEFARDVFASRASCLIIGDSTNIPGGAGTFVPYYEGMLLSLPREIQLCGFRMTGSFGDTGVNQYADFSGGSLSEMTGNRVYNRAPHIPIAWNEVAPPGIRYEFSIANSSSLPSHGTHRFASIGLVNLPGLLLNHPNWGENQTLVISTPFVVSDSGLMIPSVSMSKLSDYDSNAGGHVPHFISTVRQDIHFDTDRRGLQSIDAIFESVPNARIGVRFSGDTDLDDSNEPGKFTAWCSHKLYNKSLADQDHGLFLDSISIGGYTARDHYEVDDPHMLSEYMRIAPRPYTYVLIWIGQNVETDEWNGTLSPQWGLRIQAIVQRALEAATQAGYEHELKPILFTPPQASGVYPSPRTHAMNVTLAQVARQRGWGYLDVFSMVGNTLAGVDPGYLSGDPHPSQSGAKFIAELLYSNLDCLRAEFSGDDTRNFFDVSAFLSEFNTQGAQADMNGDGQWNFFDVSEFLRAYTTPCP